MRVREFVTEGKKQSKYTELFTNPAPGVKRYDGLDNSNPYSMWRFIVAAAGQPDGPHEMAKEGPTGQKLTTMAYSQADADILDATAKAMDFPATTISSQESTEPSLVQTTSPVKAFKGYRRR